MKENQEAIERWDRYAEEMGQAYTSEGDLNRKYLLNPVIFDLLGEVNSKIILDAGCGEGYLSRLISKRGGNVTGIDFSAKMIEIAKRKTESTNIHFEKADFQDLNNFPDNQFDIIVSNMVIHDLPEYKRAINQSYRVLKTGGFFIFSILHPCFDTPDSGWIRDKEGKKLYWKVNRYFDEGRNEQRSSADNKLLWFHRTLSSYIKTLRQAGFLIDEIIEPKPTEEAIVEHEDFIHFNNMCHFLVIKVFK